MKRKLFLFGGDKPWDSSEWTASDDRVRGGKSQSYLDCSSSCSTAKFHGTLDIATLGGAGFASQRTAGNDRNWDLSDYDGIEIKVAEADTKRYTFIVKDTLLPRNPDNGREQATISWEYDFCVSPSELERGSVATFWIPWSALKPTYRGKEKKHADKLKTAEVKRFSIMNRSFFGDQEGEFSLSLQSISAVFKCESEDDVTSETQTLATDLAEAEKGWASEKEKAMLELNSQANGEHVGRPRYMDVGVTLWWVIFWGAVVILLWK
ncbi:complex I intermediate-associated protein 30-domain-containing protein [Lineolata rhizophorae]|uniref:Complex I intermediate-associated protein 30-domain-containing protein n=1 Tax=Lineolata rhizophorae TaxID=578093 RepID=A0A6A6PB32_9PEZI|nr:complex I intermediate-associated protein 30-domain-containing protein [Lineolata rhizophorae]